MSNIYSVFLQSILLQLNNMSKYQQPTEHLGLQEELLPMLLKKIPQRKKTRLILVFKTSKCSVISVSSRLFSSCGGRTISRGPRPLPTQESRALRIEFI